MKNLIIGSVVFIGLVFVTRTYLFKREEVKLPKYSSYLSCQGNPIDVKVKFQSTAYLVNKGLPESEKGKTALSYGVAYYQNLFTFMNLAKINHEDPIKSLGLGSRPKIIILKSEPAEYPTTAEFEGNEEVSGFPPEQVDYLKKIIASKKIDKGEPATKVTYEYENNVFVCAKSELIQDLKNIKYVQPLDPYFSYFIVPISQRRSIQNPIWNAKAVVNPCLHQGAVASNGVAPFAFWYHWLPGLEGRDTEGTPFNCSLYYSEGKSIQAVNVELQENPPRKTDYLNFAKFDNLQRPIKATFVIGANNNTDFKEFDEADVQSVISHVASDIDFKEMKSSLVDTQKKYDVSFSSMLVLLWNVKKHMDVVKIDTHVEKTSVMVSMKGKLKLSKKDLELNLSVSRNKPRSAGSDIFARNFSDALMTSDIVTYVGHAAYGDTFSETIDHLNEMKSQKQDKSLSYQILALYSCSADYYFHEEKFPRIDNPDFKRDIIRTSGGFTDATGNSSLALISSLDSYLYNEAYVPFGLWAKNFKSDNFFILTNN